MRFNYSFAKLVRITCSCFYRFGKMFGFRMWIEKIAASVSCWNHQLLNRTHDGSFRNEYTLLAFIYLNWELALCLSLGLDCSFSLPRAAQSLFRCSFQGAVKIHSSQTGNLCIRTSSVRNLMILFLMTRNLCEKSLQVLSNRINVHSLNGKWVSFASCRELNQRYSTEMTRFQDDLFLKIKLRNAWINSQKWMDVKYIKIKRE